jgi:hypothetical protein
MYKLIHPRKRVINWRGGNEWEVIILAWITAAVVNNSKI